MQTKLRRYRNSLVTDGGGIIAFGLWGVIKFIISYFSDSLFSSTDLDDEIANSTFYIVMSVMLMIIIISIILSINCYIGMSAYKEGINGKKGSFYLVAAAFLVLIVLGEMTLYFVPDSSNEIGLISRLAAFFIDLTKAIILLDMLYAAFMSRRISKKIASAR